MFRKNLSQISSPATIFNYDYGFYHPTIVLSRIGRVAEHELFKIDETDLLYTNL